MDYDQFSKQIEKTGFVLENRIAGLLKDAGWTVISSRFYVDDAEESIREIDLVAYRITKVLHFTVFTVMIISCKKSEANSWALLARDIDLKDPNSDWYPLHAWTNDKILDFQVRAIDHKKRYHERMAAVDVKNVLQAPFVDVFAFQEMNKISGVPHNDKSIFAAITSLMKAQAYEIGALPLRKKTPVIYQFNLLSIVESDIVRLHFSGEKVKATSIDSEHYIARYIVHKKETSSRIRFLRADKFADFLPEYSRLHQANVQWFEMEYMSFYLDIVKDPKRVDLLLEDFARDVWWYILYTLKIDDPKMFPVSELGLVWSEAKEILEVSVPWNVNVDSLKRNKSLIAQVSGSLKRVYRYTGPFEFESHLPF